MANHKTGFSYYNVDTDRYQDIKIKRLKKDFSCAGIAVYDYILSEIYRVKGCFIEWDSNTAFDVADYFGIKESLVSEIVSYCCNVGLFNKELLASGGVVTSESIQKRYMEMCGRAKRTNVTIPEVCRIIPEESTKLQEETQDSSGSLPQSKVEKSKVEERKESNITDASASSDVSFSVKADFFITKFNELRGTQDKPTNYKLTDKVKSALKARIREGYGSEQIFTALRNAMADTFHKDNGYKYLTPEFILRSEKLEKHLNVAAATPVIDIKALTNSQKRHLGLMAPLQ